MGYNFWLWKYKWYGTITKSMGGEPVGTDSLYFALPLRNAVFPAGSLCCGRRLYPCLHRRGVTWTVYFHSAPQNTKESVIFTMKYDFTAIEQKWQDRWAKEQPFACLHRRGGTWRAFLFLCPKGSPKGPACRLDPGAGGTWIFLSSPKDTLLPL